MGTVVHLTDQSIQLSANNWNSAYKIATTYQSVSGDFIDSTTLNSVSSLLLPVSIYQEASGNWQGTFTTVQSNSSNWDTAYNISTVLQSTSGNYLSLSGGTVTGKTIISHDGDVVDPNSIYTLSIQRNSVSTWLEILNSGGPNQGAFFGMNSDNFEQWNYQGGDILFYTAETPTDGSERLIIKNNGNVGIGVLNPASRLQVNGTITTDAISFTSPAKFYSTGGNISFLHVDDTTNGNNDIYFKIEHENSDNQPTGFITIGTRGAVNKARYSGQVSGMTTNVVIEANTGGWDGNSIILTFDGVATIDTVIAIWNAANPSNQVTLISGDGTQIPDNGAVIGLAGGGDAAYIQGQNSEFRIEQSVDTLADIKSRNVILVDSNTFKGTFNAQGKLAANRTYDLPNADGTLALGNQTLNTTDNVDFNQVNANVYLSGGTNLLNILSSSGGTDLTTVTNYLSTNNVLISALTVAGDLSASKFYGDGSNLTNINFVLSSNNVTLSTTTLDPIATLSSTTFITSRVLQDKLGEVISVKDFGARGNGVTNDWLPIQRALSAAAGVARVFIPGGLYFISQELRIPSNSYIYGAGIGSTVIKLSSTANATQCVMTNSQNTRSVATNQGNENIVIKDLELDGNVSRFPGSYSPVGDTSGTGLCLANVHNAFIERVSVHDTCRHCIDICAPETSITFNPLDYVANPSYNIHLKDITAYGAGDDNITTHFSHSIIIENAYVPYTGGTEVPSNSNGIEIDDGSYDITIIGGYIKNCRRGLEIKGHSWAPAAKRVKVYGLTVENCVRNFGIRHLGFDNTDSKTAFDVALYDCTSIAPVSSTFTADAPRSLQISNYDGVFVKDFKVVGEHNASRAVTIQERARNVNFDGITFTQISGSITGITDAMLYIDSTADRNIVVRNAYFRDCIGLPIAAIGSVPGVIIDGVDARTSLSANPPARVIDFSWSPLDVPYIIRNVTTSGYLSAYQLGGTHDFDFPTTIDVGRITNIIPSSPATANTQYTVARFGWREGTGQGLNTGLGTRIEFTGSVVSGVSANIDIPVAYIGTRKVNATDSDATSNLTFGTLSANNSTAVDRLTITPTGNIGINTTTPNERLTVVGNISSTGIISVPNQTALSGSYVLTRDLTDARYFPWSPAAHCFGPIGPAFATNAALGPYMMQSRADSSYVFNWANNSSIAIGLPFFCNNGKSLSSVRINHTAGTNSNASATLEVGLYAANSSGLPDTFIDKVAFSLSATGSKVANLTTPYTPTGLFWALMRPISGDTDFKDVTKGGNGTSLTITGYGNGYNLWASQFFGFGVNDSGPTQFHGSLMPRRGSYSTPLPTSSVLSEIAMLQTASITYPCVILY